MKEFCEEYKETGCKISYRAGLTERALRDYTFKNYLPAGEEFSGDHGVLTLQRKPDAEEMAGIQPRMELDICFRKLDGRWVDTGPCPQR